MPIPRTAIAALLLVGRPAWAQDPCPPACPVKGGGPAASDCLLEFSGLPEAPQEPRIFECTDGDPSCDADPTPGVCGFDLRGCINNADPTLPTCSAGGVDRLVVRGGGAEGRQLQLALQRPPLPTAAFEEQADGSPRFVPLREPPRDVEVARLLAAVRRRIIRLLGRHGIDLEGGLGPSRRRCTRWSASTSRPFSPRRASAAAARGCRAS